MNNTFSDQLGGMDGVFEQWGACERTVVACSLARRVPWPGLKLLQRAVDAALAQHIGDDRLERDANDEVLLAGLLAARDDNEDDGERYRQLLTLLPLLRNDNERAKDVYMSAVPALVQRCMDVPRRSSVAPELCRQLLSYLLVHPALTHHDQSTLKQWLRYLENHMSSSTNPTENLWQQRIDHSVPHTNNIWGSNSSFRRTVGKNVEFRGIVDTIDHSTYSTELLQESFSKNGRDVDISLEGEKLNFDAAISQPKSQRSNSLTPPSSNFMHMSSSAENLSDEPFVQKPRSFSLSSEHSFSQLRPISVMYGTTGSETRLDDLKSNNFAEYPGMSMVAQWLKSLRLHKYVWLFTNISFEQMMSIDEEYLEKLGVTKGARHKLLLSIRKLHERQAALEAMEASLAGAAAAGAAGAAAGAALTARALERLRAVLVSPMPPGTELPQAIVRVLELASKRLTAGPPGTNFPLARVPYPHPHPHPHAHAHDDEHESGLVDPMSLHCWLVEKALHHESFSSPELTCALRRLRHRLPPRQFFSHVGDMPHRRNTNTRWRPHLPRRAGPRPPPRGKSHSYPPHAAAAAAAAASAAHHDYSSLDALCLQMTQQAIE